VLMRLKIDDGC